MSLHVSLPVYKASYDLLLVIFQFTKEFNQEYKYTVGDSLKQINLDKFVQVNEKVESISRRYTAWKKQGIRGFFMSIDPGLLLDRLFAFAS